MRIKNLGCVDTDPSRVDFSLSPLSARGVSDRVLWGAVLGTVGSLAASLAFPHWHPPYPSCKDQKCLQTVPDVDPGGTKLPHLRSIILEHLLKCVGLEVNNL